MGHPFFWGGVEEKRQLQQQILRFVQDDNESELLFDGLVEGVDGQAA